MSKKIGFWSVLALVIGSQVGSGVFTLPNTIAPFGYYGLAGWLLSGLGAISLALVFAKLCSWYPQTGGPHVYIQAAFGRKAAFFTGWTYWVVSWVSTAAVVVACVGYMQPLIHMESYNLILEVALLLAIAYLNFKGVSSAGRSEFFLTIIKVIPLLLLPALALAYFDISNIQATQEAMSSPFTSLGHATLLTMWGFIGIETATTAAGSVKDPRKTIPKAIVWGTTLTAALYFFNSVAIMGAIPGTELAKSAAPYTDVAQLVFSGKWHLFISAIASIICIGTLNAWILSGAQASLGLAEDNLMPSFFKKINDNHAPYGGILVITLGISVILLLTQNKNLSGQITQIIDFSVTAFLFVYLACVAAFFRIQKKNNCEKSYLCAAVISVFFCLWVLSETPLHVLGIASLFAFSGIPFYKFCVSKKR